MPKLLDLIDPKLSDLIYIETQEAWKKTKFWDRYVSPAGQVKIKKKLDID